MMIKLTDKIKINKIEILPNGELSLSAEMLFEKKPPIAINFNLNMIANVYFKFDETNENEIPKFVQLSIHTKTQTQTQNVLKTIKMKTDKPYTTKPDVGKYIAAIKYTEIILTEETNGIQMKLDDIESTKFDQIAKFVQFGGQLSNNFKSELNDQNKIESNTQIKIDAIETKSKAIFEDGGIITISLFGQDPNLIKKIIVNFQ